ncbi:MAG TPA: ABC transporter substrate-binding protein [Thermoleophilia bacterium]|nr:ABC transporter substrate-binding protein [Thermoleophilia bacterium]
MRGRTFGLGAAMLAVVVVATLAIAIAGCGGDENDTGDGGSQEPIKIGAILSLTGTYAGLGEPEKNLIEMEVKKINDAGGINGRPVEVIIEDDATDEAQAVAAASRLIEQENVVAIIGATGTGQTMAIRGDVQRAGIPQVSMAGGTVITNPVDPQVFATPWSNTIVVPFTLDYLKSQGITKIGLITDSGGFGKDGQAVFATEAPKAGAEIVADETFNPGDTDMTAQLTKIKNSDAQAIVMWTAGSEAAIIAKNAQDLGIDLPVYGSHGIARREFIDGAGEAANGVKFAAGKILIPEAYGEDTEAYAVATAFIDEYTQAYGEAPNTFAGHAYDALYLVVEAAKRIEGDITPEALRDELENTAGFVGIGGTFNLSPDDHNGMTQDDLSMYEISGGDWTLAQ